MSLLQLPHPLVHPIFFFYHIIFFRSINTLRESSLSPQWFLCLCGWGGSIFPKFILYLLSYYKVLRIYRPHDESPFWREGTINCLNGSEPLWYVLRTFFRSLWNTHFISVVLLWNSVLCTVTVYYCLLFIVLRVWVCLCACLSILVLRYF